MKQFASYEIFSAALVCFLACGLRIAAEANRRREERPPRAITFWWCVFTVFACFVFGFLTVNFLHESDMGNGKKLSLVALASFLGPAGVDALMLVSGKMILHEFSKWLSAKTGQQSSIEPESDFSHQEPNHDEAIDTEAGKAE